MGSKFQSQANTVSPPGLNIAPAKDHSITSSLIRDASKDDDAFILGGSSLALDPAGEYISILGDNTSITGIGVYPTGDESLGYSTATGITSASKVEQATSLLTQ